MIALDTTHVAVDVPGQVVELSLDGKLLAAHPLLGTVRALAYVDGRLWAATDGGLYAWEGNRLVVTRSERVVNGIGAPVPGARETAEDGVIVSSGASRGAPCLRGPDGATWCNQGDHVRRLSDDREIQGVLLAGGPLGLVIAFGAVSLRDVDGKELRRLPGPEVAMADDLLAVRTGTSVALSGARNTSWAIPPVPVPAPMTVPAGALLVHWSGWVDRINPATGASLARYAATDAEVDRGRLVAHRATIEARTNALGYDDGVSSWIAAIPGVPGPRLGDIVTLVGEDRAIYGLATETGATRWRVPTGDGGGERERVDAQRAGSWIVVTPAAREWFTLDAAGKRGRAGDGELAGCDGGDEPLVALTSTTGPVILDLRDGATTAVPEGACPVGRLADGSVAWTRAGEVGVSDAHGVRWRQRSFDHPVHAGAVNDLVLLGWAGLVAVDGRTGEPRWARTEMDGVEGYTRVP